jgi:hypothetical protein
MCPFYNVSSVLSTNADQDARRWSSVTLTPAFHGETLATTYRRIADGLPVPSRITPAYITQSLKGVNLLVDLLSDLHDGVARNCEDFLERHGVVTRQWLNKIALVLPEGTQRIWWEGGEERFPNQATTTEYQLPDRTIIHTRWGNGTFGLHGGHYSGYKKEEQTRVLPGGS